MQSSLQYLVRDADDTKRLNSEFADRRIVFGFNNRTRRKEAWYVPDQSRPYMITPAVNVQHALRLLRARLEHDKVRARVLLAQIDEHNEKLSGSVKDDAMYAVKSDLRTIASGKKFFT